MGLVYAIPVNTVKVTERVLYIVSILCSRRTFPLKIAASLPRRAKYTEFSSNGSAYSLSVPTADVVVVSSLVTKHFLMFSFYATRQMKMI